MRPPLVAARFGDFLLWEQPFDFAALPSAGRRDRTPFLSRKFRLLASGSQTVNAGAAWFWSCSRSSAALGERPLLGGFRLGLRRLGVGVGRARIGIDRQRQELLRHHLAEIDGFAGPPVRRLDIVGLGDLQIGDLSALRASRCIADRRDSSMASNRLQRDHAFLDHLGLKWPVTTRISPVPGPRDRS